MKLLAMMGLLTLPLILPGSAKAQNAKAVLEGVRTTNDTILVSTRNVRVLISTRSYNGTISNVGLYTSSNVVISDTNADKCVIYATGSINCLGATLSGGSAGTFVLREGDTMTGHLSIKASSMTLYGAFKATGASDIQNLSQPATFASSTTHNAGAIIRQPADIQNFSQASTFASSVTINSTMTVSGLTKNTGGGYSFPDGTIQVAAAVVGNSSSTQFGNASASIDSGVMVTSVLISTLTITMQGNTKAQIKFRCPTSLSASGSTIIGVILDGAYFDNQTSTKGLIAADTGGTILPIDLEHTTTNDLSAASHSFAMVFSETSAGSISINPSGLANCQFRVTEVNE